MPKYEAFDWYENPLYYDIIFDVDTETEASFVDAVYERHVQTRGRRMLEPACGSGRLVAAMARRGFNVTGFDLSEEMLRFARRRLREKHLKARLV
ncbi:MAG: class I SAM-dependent methyltransferase, partial [Phycisphaerales bacterium]